MPAAPNGSVMKYAGRWVPGTFTSARDVISAVGSDLTNNGIVVRSESDDAGFLQNATPPSVSPFNVNLTLQVQNGLGFGDVNDVISIVRHWVLQESGSFPISDSIPSIQVPTQVGGTGQVQDTGQPSQTPDPGSVTPAKGLWDTLTGLVSDTTSSIGISVVLIGIGLLIAKKENWI